MDSTQIFALIIYILIVIAIARITANLYKGYKLRKQRKMTPGPLLGVVFPKDKKDKK